MVRRKKTRGDVTDEIITMSSLLNPHEECSEPRTVLIEGEPGIGKTTYCKKYVYDWATKKQNPHDCITNIKVVLFLKCRDIKSNIWEAINDQLLPRDVDEKVKRQFFQFIRANQSSILLILDGLDELPSSEVPTISEIIAARVLPKCKVVATARHEAGVKVRKFCDTLLEVEGFTKEQAREFIAKYFKEKSDLAELLSARVSRDKNFRDMCANPLNTALLCLLCEEFGGTLPEKRTTLYLNMIECVLRRYRKKTELPDTKEDLTNLYKPQLKTLGLIALNGLIQGKLDFEENELGKHASDLAAFGFLSVHSGGTKLRPSLYYAFLHKSFQECFAAFYICCEIQDKRITPEELVSDDRYSFELTQVLTFSCGILAEQSNQEAAALVLSLGNRVKNRINKNYGNKLWNGSVEFLLEVTNLSGKTGSILKFLFSSLGNRVKNHGHENDWNVKFLLEVINECKMKKDDVHLQLARWFGCNWNQRNLCLLGQFKGEGLAAILCEAIKVNKTLTNLDLSVNGINEAGATSIAEAIKVNKTLTNLKLSVNRISDAGATYIAEAIKVNKILTNLDLSVNGINEAGATSIAEAIKVNKTLTNLKLSVNRISDAGATYIAEAIKVNKILTNLDLSVNGINEAGATSIAEAIKVNKTLTNLKLSVNRISDAGATYIAEAIKVNKTLTYLTLSECGISDAGVISIAEAIKVNKTLTHLDLYRNGFSDAGAKSIAEAIKVNKTLTDLDFSRNGLSDAGVASIAEAIKVNKTVTALDLSRNGISDAGATYIAEAIKVNKTLTYLTLSECGISDAGVISIAEGIKVNKTLTDLDLSHNGFSDAGARSIAEAIKVNKTLTYLTLSECGISDSIATSIAETIEGNRTVTHLASLLGIMLVSLVFRLLPRELILARLSLIWVCSAAVLLMPVLCLFPRESESKRFLPIWTYLGMELVMPVLHLFLRQSKSTRQSTIWICLAMILVMWCYIYS